METDPLSHRHPTRLSPARTHVLRLAAGMLVLLLHAQNSLSQNPCLCTPIFQPGDPFLISGDVFMDTCNLDGTYHTDCRDAVLHIQREYLYTRMYVRGPWLVIMPEGSLSLPAAPPDTLLYTHWRAISPDFPELRKGFQEIEEIYGATRLRKKWPEATTGASSRSYELYVDTEPMSLSEADVLMFHVLYHVNHISGMYGIFYYSGMEERKERDLIDVSVAFLSNDEIALESTNRGTRQATIVDVFGVARKTVVLEPYQPCLVTVSDLNSGLYFVVSGDRVVPFRIVR